MCDEGDLGRMAQAVAQLEGIIEEEMPEEDKKNNRETTEK